MNNYSCSANKCGEEVCKNADQNLRKFGKILLPWY